MLKAADCIFDENQKQIGLSKKATSIHNRVMYAKRRTFIKGMLDSTDASLLVRARTVIMDCVEDLRHAVYDDDLGVSWVVIQETLVPYLTSSKLSTPAVLDVPMSRAVLTVLQITATWLRPEWRTVPASFCTTVVAVFDLYWAHAHALQVPTADCLANVEAAIRLLALLALKHKSSVLCYVAKVTRVASCAWVPHSTVARCLSFLRNCLHKVPATVLCEERDAIVALCMEVLQARAGDSDCVWGALGCFRNLATMLVPVEALAPAVPRGMEALVMHPLSDVATEAYSFFWNLCCQPGNVLAPVAGMEAVVDALESHCTLGKYLGDASAMTAMMGCAACLVCDHRSLRERAARSKLSVAVLHYIAQIGIGWKEQGLYRTVLYGVEHLQHMASFGMLAAQFVDVQDTVQCLSTVMHNVATRDVLDRRCSTFMVMALKVLQDVAPVATDPEAALGPLSTMCGFSLTQAVFDATVAVTKREVSASFLFPRMPFSVRV